MKIIWFVTIFFYCTCMTITFISIFDNFNKNSVSFLTETTYLEWNTSFPAVSVCQISGMDLSVNGDLKKEYEHSASMEYFLADILFFTGSCYSCQGPCDACSRFNLTDLVKKLRKPCNQLLTICKWNNVDFDCCEHFLELETEFGICFALNSLHTTFRSSLNLKMNRLTGPGELFLQTVEDVRVYYHAPEEVPFINIDSNYRKDILVGDFYNILFNVVEIENDHNVEAVPIYKRECRYFWERPDQLKVHLYYSYSSCMVQCHAENQLRLCNCTHHLMPFYNQERHCDIQGLICLTDYAETLNRIHAKGSNKPGLVCDCLPSCTESEYFIVSEEKKTDETTSGISLKMQSLPNSRFKRVVVKSLLDLVVSVGGAAGLFIGASILTIIEIFYLLLLKD